MKCFRSTDTVTHVASPQGRDDSKRQPNNLEMLFGGPAVFPLIRCITRLYNLIFRSGSVERPLDPADPAPGAGGRGWTSDAGASSPEGVAAAFPVLCPRAHHPEQRAHQLLTHRKPRAALIFPSRRGGGTDPRRHAKRHRRRQRRSFLPSVRRTRRPTSTGGSRGLGRRPLFPASGSAPPRPRGPRRPSRADAAPLTPQPRSARAVAPSRGPRGLSQLEEACGRLGPRRPRGWRTPWRRPRREAPGERQNPRTGKGGSAPGPQGRRAPRGPTLLAPGGPRGLGCRMSRAPFFPRPEVLLSLLLLLSNCEAVIQRPGLQGAFAGLPGTGWPGVLARAPASAGGGEGTSRSPGRVNDRRAP